MHEHFPNNADLFFPHLTKFNTFNFLFTLNKKFPTTVKPVLRGHLKIDKTKVLKTNGSLMKVKTFDLQLVLIRLINQFLVFFEWLLKTGFTVLNMII